MNQEIRLDNYATTPLYNIKAVVQATDISPSTLRAWERRYSICDPQRSESGYRLYSDQDVAVIRWLKIQVAAGISISQAVARLNSMVAEAGGRNETVLPLNAAASAQPSNGFSATSAYRSPVRNTDILEAELLDALTGYREQAAEEILADAFSLYPMEQVIEEIIVPVLARIGQRWQDGEVGITTEHFASNYLIQRLSVLLRAGAPATSGPAIWIGCAPDERHEIGPLILALFLRRAGHNVRYLGSNLPMADLVNEVATERPACLIFSANSEATALKLGELSREIDRLSAPCPVIGYGGRIFNEKPRLRDIVYGTFLGTTAHEAVYSLNDLMKNAPRRGESLRAL